MLNFGENIRFRPAKTYTPGSERQLLAILRQYAATSRIRCVGALHSWSGLAGSTDGIIALDLRHFDHVELIGGSAQYVRVGAGCTIGRLLDELRRHGRTLPTVGAIVKQTIAGATATGTHGSGSSSLSHFIEGVRLAVCDANGKARIVTIHGGKELLAARCSLGLLGVVLSVVMRTEPLYNVEERFEEVLLERIGATRDKKRIDRGLLEKVLGGEREWPLQQFALIPWRWSYIVWRRRRTLKHGHWLWRYVYRARLWLWNDVSLHLFLRYFVRFASPECIKALYRRKPLASYPHRVDDSRAILTLDHGRFRHVEMEVFVPEAELAHAIDALKTLIEEHDQKGLWTHHYPISFRRVGPDDTLISMTSGDRLDNGARYAISLFTYLPVERGFDAFANAVAKRMVRKHRARLHWGKYFPLSAAEACAAYPGAHKFEEIRRSLDPGNAFWTDRLSTLPASAAARATLAAAATPQSSDSAD